MFAWLKICSDLHVFNFSSFSQNFSIESESGKLKPKLWYVMVALLCSFSFCFFSLPPSFLGLVSLTFLLGRDSGQGRACPLALGIRLPSPTWGSSSFFQWGLRLLVRGCGWAFLLGGAGYFLPSRGGDTREGAKTNFRQTKGNTKARQEAEPICSLWQDWPMHIVDWFFSCLLTPLK